MAIVCKEAAEEYIAVNNDFEIYAPLVMNSDIILISSDKIKEVGMTANKGFHKDFIIQKYSDVKLHEMNAQALPYSYETGRVDAVIMDITKLGDLKGKVIEPSKEDYVTYVLIVKSDYIKTNEFREFVSSYNEAIERLTNSEEITDYMMEYSNLNERRREEWKVKLLRINGPN